MDAWTFVQTVHCIVKNCLRGMKEFWTIRNDKLVHEWKENWWVFLMYSSWPFISCGQSEETARVLNNDLRILVDCDRLRTINKKSSIYICVQVHRRNFDIGNEKWRMDTFRWDQLSFWWNFEHNIFSSSFKPILPCGREYYNHSSSWIQTLLLYESSSFKCW